MFIFSILLHAKLQDYAVCTAIAHIWLYHPDNYDRRDYAAVAELFITQVLVPQRKWNEIVTFTESCHGIDAETKAKYLTFERSLSQQHEHAHIDDIEQLGTSEQLGTIEQPPRQAVTGSAIGRHTTEVATQLTE